MKILIDADGCPVVDVTVRMAEESSMDCFIFCDTSHIFEKSGATTMTFSKGADSVDFALVNRVLPGDIVITQDYGLAAMCLSKNAIVINQDGMEYTAHNIDHGDRRGRDGLLRGVDRSQTRAVIARRQIILIQIKKQPPG